MGRFKSRFFTIQSSIQPIFRLTLLFVCLSGLSALNQTNTLRKTGETGDVVDMEGGKQALIVVCLSIVFLSIITIAAHYCDFHSKRAYQKLTKQRKENELVEINLYESEEEDTTSKISM